MKTPRFKLPQLLAGFLLVALWLGCGSPPPEPEPSQGEAPDPPPAHLPTVAPAPLDTEAAGTALWFDGERLWLGLYHQENRAIRVRSLESGTWTDQSVGLEQASPVVDLWGNGEGALLACGIGEIWRFVDGRWVSFMATGDPTALAVSGVGDALVFTCYYYTRLVRTTLSAPEVQTQGSSSITPTAVWMFAPNDVVIVDNHRRVLRYQGGDWSDSAAWPELPLPAPIGERNLNDLWSPDGENLYLVGEGGLILNVGSSGVQDDSQPGTPTLNAVWGSGERVVAVGEAGTILVRADGRWHSVASGTEVSLMAVTGAADRVWIAGAAGTLLELTWP